MILKPDGKGAVTVKDSFQSRYGPKALLGGDTYDAKEAIKELEWDETHRGWNSELESWEIDYDALDALEAKLEEHGFSLGGLGADVIDALEPASDLHDAGMWETLEIRITVTYESKQSDRILEKSGIVYAVDRTENDAMFRRDDGTVMRISGNDLYTTHSQYPFVGNIVEVEIEEKDCKVCGEPHLEPIVDSHHEAAERAEEEYGVSI